MLHVEEVGGGREVSWVQSLRFPFTAHVIIKFTWGVYTHASLSLSFYLSLCRSQDTLWWFVLLFVYTPGIKLKFCQAWQRMSAKPSLPSLGFRYER